MTAGSMKKYVITGIACLIAGAITGIAVTIFVYPFIFPLPVINEQIADVEAKEKVSFGVFIHPNPSDPLHRGKGNVTLYRQEHETEVFLEKDFEVGPGPAYHVYLSAGTDIKNNDDFKNTANIDLGGLKSFKGSQLYNVPGDVDMSGIHSVVIWCEVFGQLIASARLQMPGLPATNPVP
jgi:hypothetical protein